MDTSLGFSITIITLFVIMAILLTNILVWTPKAMETVQSDLNVLKSNDVAFAQYITANSQTLEYLNKNCKVTNDTNEVTTLTCIKVKQ